MNKKIAENRKAYFDYNVIETVEAGVILLGSEVKSIRIGRISIKESYADVQGNEFFLFNANIPQYSLAAMGQNHEPKRIRKLLLHKRESNKIYGLIKRDGFTVIPINFHFNEKGKVKVLLGLAKGKKQVDKRETIKKRDWNRKKQMILKNK